MVGIIPSGIHDPERVLGPALIQGPGDRNKFIAVLVVSIRVKGVRKDLCRNGIGSASRKASVGSRTELST